MKSLLAMTAMGALAANIVTPLINNNFAGNEATQAVEEKGFTFYDNSGIFEFQNNYAYNEGEHIYKFMFEYNIDNINIKDYSYFSAWDPGHRYYTKTSWG